MKMGRAFLLITLSVSVLSLSRSSSADAPAIQTAAILDGVVTVPAASFLSYPVSVDLASMTTPTIKGVVLASGGSGNDVDVLLLSDTDFLNWKNGHPVTPLYDSGKVTDAEVLARPSTSGTYYMVLSNTFSAITPKTVGAKVQLLWVPTALIESEQRTTRGLNILLVVSVVLLVASVAVLWSSLANARKKKAAAEPERKAA